MAPEHRSTGECSHETCVVGDLLDGAGRRRLRAVVLPGRRAGAGHVSLRPRQRAGAAGFGFVLVTAGLIASTLHLGRPERAWRALTQWDSSWLSREGLAALTTYLPVLLVAGLARGHNLYPPTRAAGAVLTACSLVTLVCTARIYTSLKPIRAWRDPHVLPLYLLFALLSGGLWLWTYLAFDTGSHPPWFPLVLALLGVAAAGMKIDYWRAIDRAPAVTAGEAT